MTYYRLRILSKNFSLFGLFSDLQFNSADSTFSAISLAEINPIVNPPLFLPVNPAVTADPDTSAVPVASKVTHASKSSLEAKRPRKKLRNDEESSEVEVDESANKQKTYSRNPAQRERNRLSAQESRRKAKQLVSTLKEENEKLKQENQEKDKTIAKLESQVFQMRQTLSTLHTYVADEAHKLAGCTEGNRKFEKTNSIYA